jgi:hypothetical protein
LPTPPAGDGPLAIRDFRVWSDEAYVHLRLDVGAIDWSRGRYLIAIDTYRPELGGRTLPRTGAACATGFEFVVDLVGPEGSELLVDRPYNLYRSVPLPGSDPPQVMQVYNRPWRSIAHDDPQWDTLLVETNRSRVGRDGTVYPRTVYPRNQLRHAREADHSLADWYADPATGVIELRLGWGMLQVLDPSSHWVLQGTDADGRSPAGATTDGFRFALASYDPTAPTTSGVRIGCGTGADRPHHFEWLPWETPRWHQRIKPLFGAMQATFGGLTAPVRSGAATAPSR